jgi:hypothetical protein
LAFGNDPEAITKAFKKARSFNPSRPEFLEPNKTEKEVAS